MVRRAFAAAVIFLLLLIMPAGISAAALTIVPSDAVEFEGHYYKIYNDLEELRDERYALAKKLCAKRGGHLAVPESEEESIFLHGLISQSGLKRAVIGLKYEDGVWVRADGGELTYEGWAEGAADLAGDGDCAVIEKGSDGAWKTAVFGKGYSAYICEWDKGRKTSDYDIGYAREFVPEYTVKHGNSRYMLFNNCMTRSEAQSFCRSMGGLLVTVNDADEQAFLNGLISAEGKRAMYWIGAYYINENDRWRWLSSDSFTYSNWGKGQPKYHSFDVKYCAMNGSLERFDVGQWIAEADYGRLDKIDEYYTNIGFICEWNLVCGDSFYHGNTETITESEATCRTAGLERTVCTDCGKEISSVTIPLKEHAYMEVPVFMGIRIPGIIIEKCVNCGAEKRSFDVKKIWFAPVLVLLVMTMTVSFLSVWVTQCRERKRSGLRIYAPPFWMLLIGYFFIAMIMFVLYHIFIL